MPLVAQASACVVLVFQPFGTAHRLKAVLRDPAERARA